MADNSRTHQDIISQTVTNTLDLLETQNGTDHSKNAALRTNLEKIATAVATRTSTSGFEFETMLPQTAHLCGLNSGNEVLALVQDAYDAIAGKSREASAWLKSPVIRTEQEQRIAERLKVYRLKREEQRVGTSNTQHR